MATLRISSTQSSPDTEFRLFADAAIEASNRRWKITGYITAINRGTTGSFYSGSGTHRGYINGTLFRTHSGTPFLPSGVSSGGTRWNEGPYTVYVDAPEDGTLTIPLRMTMNYGAVDYDHTVNYALPSMGWVTPSTPAKPTVVSNAVGAFTATWTKPSGTITGYDLRYRVDGGAWVTKSTTSLSMTVSGLTPGGLVEVQVRAKNAGGVGAYSSSATATMDANAPSAPATPTMSSVTTTSAVASWTAPADGGSPLTGYDVQWNTAQSETGATTASQGTTTTKTLDSLTPGTGYFVRVRGKSAAGDGAWSAWRPFSTVPAVAPGMTVTASADGRAATIALTPPGGVTGVTKYQIQRRVGTGAATTLETTTSPYVATGLTPGTAYQWRSSAFIDTYQSPWTDWVTVAQPRPNTNPGDYFDGATAATDDNTYGWTGPVNKSTSQATGVAPLGWVTFAQGAAVSGGTGVVARVSDPIATYPDGSAAGQFAARATFFTDTAAPGFVLGPVPAAGYASEVSQGGVYTGSIFVRPSADQSLAARIVWLDAAYAALSMDVGSFTTVLAEDVQRLSVVATAPAGAVFAVCQAVDANGWSAGDSLTADGDMISLEGTPYFDGAAPDSALFAYDWVDVANNGPSIRTNVVQQVVDPLLDPDCPPMPSPPLPPTVDSDCIEEIGVWRRYYSVIPDDQVSLWATTLPTLVLTTGGAAERQIRIRVYPNPDNLAPEQVDTSVWSAEMIVSYLPAFTALTIDAVSQRALAVVGASADSVPADRLLYGTGGIPPTWPVLECGTAYLISFDTPLDSPSGNLSAEVYLTDRVM
jgi:hypothetical protein